MSYQLRTAPQSCDQTFENNFNASLKVHSFSLNTPFQLTNGLLKRSCETKKPIRVIRGYKLDSVYGPAEGYRYDGLYTVEDVRLLCAFDHPPSLINMMWLVGLSGDGPPWLQGLQIRIQGNPIPSCFMCGES